MGMGRVYAYLWPSSIGKRYRVWSSDPSSLFRRLDCSLSLLVRVEARTWRLCTLIVLENWGRYFLASRKPIPLYTRGHALSYHPISLNYTSFRRNHGKRNGRTVVVPLGFPFNMVARARLWYVQVLERVSIVGGMPTHEL